MTNYDEFTKGYKGLFETELTDLLHDDSLDTRCLSYALKKAMEQLQDYSERIVIHYNIDKLPEEILDYLAVEKQLPYYSGDFDTQLKRDLVKEGMSWYFIAGTKKGVESLIQTIFGSGEIKEWFEFDEEEQEKGTFDINIRNEHITEDAVERFTKILKRAKNVSRHLRKVSENHDTLSPSFVLDTVLLTDEIIIR